MRFPLRTIASIQRTKFIRIQSSLPLWREVICDVARVVSCTVERKVERCKYLQLVGACHQQVGLSHLALVENHLHLQATLGIQSKSIPVNFLIISFYVSTARKIISSYICKYICLEKNTFHILQNS